MPGSKRNRHGERIGQFRMMCLSTQCRNHDDHGVTTANYSDRIYNMHALHEPPPMLDLHRARDAQIGPGPGRATAPATGSRPSLL
jgi:hypothetical protein